MRTALLIAGLAVGLVAALYLQRQSYSDEDDDAFRAALWQVREVDEAFQVDLLRVRFLMLKNYDGLDRSLDEIDRLLARMQEIPSFVGPQGRHEIEQATAAVESLLVQRRALFEHFKSRNAIVSNSQRYLPVALAELDERLTSSADDRELAAELHALTRDLLASVATTEPPTLEDLAALQRLDRWAVHHPDHVHAPFAQTMVRHAHVLLEGSEALDALVERILELGHARELDRLSTIYQRELSAAIDRARTFQLLRDALIVVLVIAIVYALWALRSANRRLESRVGDRTRELKDASLQLLRTVGSLQSEMDRRTRAELELQQSQKLEAVGRLAAGVAHEINTPVQFVNDSCHFLRDGLSDLQNLVGTYRGALQSVAQGEVPVKTALAQARAAEDAIDLAYLEENLPGAVNRSLEGLERVATIVRSMKEFAHPDQKEKTHADLNQAILSTLTVARNEYKYVADVETDLGDLPPVCCFLSELNQAVLNIVVNAAHAVGDAVQGSDRRGRIRVCTRHEGDQVVIAIQDDGPGIPESIRSKIFDPFFTTKEVGKGTGQGLAIVRSVVVDKHQGSIAVDSIPGHGTTFTLTLPVEAPSSPPTPIEALAA